MKTYFANKASFTRAILDPNYLLDVVWLNDGRDIRTNFVTPISTITRLPDRYDTFEVSTVGAKQPCIVILV